MDTRVRIKIEGGVIDVFHIPDGVTVEVIDYDVEGDDSDELDQYDQGDGTKAYCRHWVEHSDHSARNCEYDSDKGWGRWLAAETVGSQV